MFTLQLVKHVTKCSTPFSLLMVGKNIAAKGFARIADCTPRPPHCGTEMSRNLIGDGCTKPVKGSKTYPKEKFKSMWENPQCCNEACPDLLTRYDELYYRPSDKTKKCYKQTWVECPDLKLARKVICEHKNCGYPQLERRPRKARSQTCELLARYTGCIEQPPSRCLRICLPGCRRARNPPKCTRLTPKYPCKKLCCPCPAYSECDRPCPERLRKKECDCLAAVPWCCCYRVRRERLCIEGGYVPL